MRARTFNIMQYLKHPQTGETLLTEDRIKEALGHKTIKRWAYVCHDADVWLADDEKEDGSHKAGEVKPTHWHIVLDTGSSAIDVTTIAKWFGVPEQYVDVPKGRGSFLDCTRYLTHEAHVEKHRYQDECIKSNFYWREELIKRDEIEKRFGCDVDRKYQIFDDVLTNGKSLLEIYKEDVCFYIDNFERLKKLRLEYLHTHAELPVLRLNFYIFGKGGTGKGLVSRALARSMFADMEDDELMFVAGSPTAPLDGYDGQPVIIWDDYRADDLIKAFGSIGNVFKVFDLHPVKSRQSVKFSTVNLVNHVNIINSVQQWNEFLARLAGDEDIYQSIRRFPVILPIREDDYDFLLNRGFVDRTRNLDYYAWYNITANFAKIARNFGKPDQVVDRKVIEKKSLSVVLDNVTSASQSHMLVDTTKEDMSGYGVSKGTCEVKFEMPIQKEM